MFKSVAELNSSLNWRETRGQRERRSTHTDATRTDATRTQLYRRFSVLRRTLSNQLINFTSCTPILGYVHQSI